MATDPSKCRYFVFILNDASPQFNRPSTPPPKTTQVVRLEQSLLVGNASKDAHPGTIQTPKWVLKLMKKE
ncbi:hypothetical protein GWI33_004292 [Rhynchophorus ferrugineus]|uniref:Uncharacterized protein n=1 Tax=Rhynchophorus ferrugineus TaxID=354439 RepID=A0A834IIV2_RHYFE|nr:hypothetical protein GWI33_004292 [Rhynchophorus ferrugineus]